MRALLSIKPEYAEKIFSGEKRFEFRKKSFCRDVSNVVVYVTAPVGKIVGEFEIVKIWEDAPRRLWEMTKQEAGISSSFFFSYFKGKTKAVAIEVGKPRRYAQAIDPYKREKRFHPPQSFRYIP